MTAVLEEERLLTDVQLAERWQLNPGHLRRLRVQRNRGDLGAGPPFVNLGRAVRYRLADILTYEQENLT